MYKSSESLTGAVLCIVAVAFICVSSFSIYINIGKGNYKILIMFDAASKGKV